MDPLAMVLQPLADIGTDISASVYKIPKNLKVEIIGGIVAMEPGLKSAMASGRAKINGVSQTGGEGLVAIGGYIEPEVFMKIHGAVMSLDGVEFVIGAGPACAGLPKTPLAYEAAGAHARSMAAKKPWWKVW